MKAIDIRVAWTRGGLALAALLATTAPGVGAQHHHAAAGSVRDSVALLDGMGSHSYRITTRSSLAQQYFNQGLSLAWAFNHPEAARSFREAVRLDSTCAMCFWGAALVLGPNINAAMSPGDVPAAHEAAGKALALSRNAQPNERALIEALAARYTPEAQENRAPLDSAYARAMRDVVQRFPDDLEAATLFAEAMMDLTPWNYWTADRRPRPGTAELISTLERVIARNPRHPGACHLYIHAVEATYPEKAVPCAERLAALMPAAGHIVHMPAHIYIRVGRYNDAIEANIHATHADETYIADQRPQPNSYLFGYYPHNYHFLAFASVLAGRSALAIEHAKYTGSRVAVEVAKVAPELQPLIPYGALTMATFGKWDDVLGEPVPSAELPVAHALATYARGLAFAARSDWDAAQAALDTIRAHHATVSQEPVRTVLAIATHGLAGEIAWRRNEVDRAIEAWRSAMALEDGLGYMEPPYWHAPVRHSLGAALLRSGKAAEAERLYREDLERFPENGWSLSGLAASLAAQGKTNDAEQVRQRLERAWGRADVSLKGSRF